MNGGPSGFHNAPVARAFVLACVLLTAVFGVRGRALRLGLSYQDIIKNFQLWRIFASVFAFSSTPELLFGVYLLYYFRVFERQMGSNKYSVFVLFSLIVSSLFEIIALMLFKDPTANVIASGPYGLIFSSFVPFYFDIPVTSRFRIFGLQFGDKSFIYLAGLQLLLSSWKRSLLPGLCGMLAGTLYHLNVFGIRRIKFPNAVARHFSRFFASSGASSSRTSPNGIILQEIFLLSPAVKLSEIIHLWHVRLLQSHLSLLSLCWYRWDLIATLRGRHSCKPEMTSTWPQTSF
uniref:Peptidase S54 rhomboid domain-containing protein n=1 Tax=Ananas comosus var. bracteatus TaxID=296719 RepID=A0A6V7PSW9_ANACO|nr:unnamed protein product [Ananas comosus var. bracteatus]